MGHDRETLPPTNPPAPPPLDASGPRSVESRVFDRLSILYRYRWASITLFALTVSWVMVDSYSQTPMYRATAQVLIDRPSDDPATPTEIAPTVPPVDLGIYVETQLRIIRGRDLATRVAEQLHLERVPEFNGQGVEPTEFARAVAAVKRYAAMPYRMIARGSTAGAPSGDSGGYEAALLNRLTAEQVRGTPLVEMSFDSADAAFAARAANTFADRYVDDAVLARDAELNRDSYNQLPARDQEPRVSASSRTNNVRVVDRAEVPARPHTPNRRQDWTYALLLGLGLGIAVAFGLDYLDDSVKTPDDVTRRLKLKFLGLVPVVEGDRHPLISGPVPHHFGEAFRTIRTSLAAQFSGHGPRVIAMASTQPLEGKTITAVNIAMALAMGGQRVLLVDADMRRPSVHKALRMSNERGLSQLLSGQARMREVVQRTHDPNLLCITAGRTPANPSELLTSDRMRALITGLESGPFDWIIIDTPPVLAVTDAVILAPMVGAVTFVIGAEMTRRRLAERAVETLLSSNPRKVLGVLNKVNFGRNKYYYSRYFGHQYKGYYAGSSAA